MFIPEEVKVILSFFIRRKDLLAGLGGRREAWAIAGLMVYVGRVFFDADVALLFIHMVVRVDCVEWGFCGGLLFWCVVVRSYFPH